MAARDPHLELPGGDEDGDSGAPGASPFDWIRLALGAAWRRKALTAGVFLVAMGASVAYFYTRRPVYRVEAKILAQRPQALPSVVRQLFEDVPTRSAWEMIHRRENLAAIIRQTNLLPEGPTPPSRPGLREWLSRMPAAAREAGAAATDPLDALVLVLDRQLTVTADEGTITIQLDWPDPQQAYAVVQAAVQNFLEARHLQEVTAIDEVISVLQARSAVLRKALEEATEEARRHPARAARAAQPGRQPSDELVRLQSVLQAKQRAIQEVEEFRQRRLVELQAQLDQARNALSDAHPTVIGLRQQLEALTRESPQVEALRNEERKARKDYNERLAREGPVTASPALTTVSEAGSSTEGDPRVREARLQYEQMEARVGAAQVERDAARAAFKYRYNVVWPPQIPREPFGPNPFKILGAGLVLSVALALAAALAPELYRGRVVERWQVEKGLDVPILAEVRRK